MSRHTVSRPSGGVPGYMPALTFAALLGAGAWYTLQPAIEVPPGKVELARLSHRNAGEAVALNGIAAGARLAVSELTRRSQTGPTVQVSASAASGMAPLPGVIVTAPDPSGLTPAVRLSGIESAQPSDRAGAKADAIRQAREKLAELFAVLRGAVELPDGDEFERQFVSADSVVERKPTDAEKAAWRAEKLDENRVWMSVSVSVTEEQLRDLRARHRLNELSRWAVVALIGLTVGYGALRLAGGRNATGP